MNVTPAPGACPDSYPVGALMVRKTATGDTTTGNAVSAANDVATPPPVPHHPTPTLARDLRLLDHSVLRAPLSLSPAEVVTLLHGVADFAAEVTAVLDLLRDRYRAIGLQGPEPEGVALEQAAAAAHDLRTGARAAADTIPAHAW